MRTAAGAEDKFTMRAIAGFRWRRGPAAAVSALFVALSLHCIAVRPARACGPTPQKANPLLPAAGAADVPLNAVLIAASTFAFEVVRFALREKVSGTTVGLSTSCEGQNGAQLCYGRPGPLRALTTYVWTAEVAGSAIPIVDREFTTGTREDQDRPLGLAIWVPGPRIDITVLEYLHTPGQPCGMPHRTRLRVVVPDLDEPAVLALAGMDAYPHPFEDPVPLGPASRSVDLTLWAAVGCLSPRLIDVAGNIRHLDPWCPSPDQGGDRPDAGTVGSANGGDANPSHTDATPPSSADGPKATARNSGSSCSLGGAATDTIVVQLPMGVLMWTLGMLALLSTSRSRRR